MPLSPVKNTHVGDQKCIVQRDKTNPEQTKRQNETKRKEEIEPLTKQECDQVLMKCMHDTLE